MRKLFKFLKEYKKDSILSPLLKMAEATLELLVPLIVAAIIDNGIGKGNISYTVKMGVWLVIFGIAGLALSLTAQFFAAKASVGFAANIRKALFKKISYLSYSDTDTIGTSTLITRMTGDINQIQTGMNLTLRLLLRSPFVVFGAMVMAFTVDFKAALIFAGVIGVLCIVVFAIMLISIPLHKKVQLKLDSVLKSTRENLSGARVIRAFCGEDEEIAEFDRKSKDLTRFQLFTGRISSLLNPLTYVIINIAILFLIYVGGIRVEAGIITQGAVVALYNYMSQILVELIKLANLIINITRSIACGQRVSAVLQTPDAMEFVTADTPDTDSPFAIEIKNADMTYSGSGEAALTDINLTVKRGETLGIIGSTGSGKSTLINLIPRFYDVSKGEVLVFGKNVRDYTPTALRGKIGIVPQKAVLFKGTLRENLKWGNENATDEELFWALECAQAKDFVMEKGGLDIEIEQGGQNLSGGQRQRLTVARALVRRPEILILDDSASALDLVTEAALRKAISELPFINTTVIIVSQRASSVMNADKTVVLDDGQIVSTGTHDQLLKTSEVYREIYNSQFKEAVQNG